MAAATKTKKSKTRVWDKDTDGWNAVPSAQQLLKLAILAWERPGLDMPMPKSRQEATDMIKDFKERELFSS